MSLNTDTNKWAPKVVIALQLATWSAVGLILVRRGSTYLRGDSGDLGNATGLEIQTIGSTRRSRVDERAVGANGAASWPERSPFTAQPRRYSPSAETARLLPSDRGRENDARLQKNRPYERFEGIGRAESEAATIGTFGYVFETEAAERVREAKDSEKTATKEKKDGRLRRTNEVNDHRSVETGVLPASVEIPGYDGETTTIRSTPSLVTRRGSDEGFTENTLGPSREEGNETRVERIEKPRSPSQLSPVSRAGTAAAIVMLAIGIVMLLVGPSIVILRAFEARRRRRRQRQRRRVGGRSRNSRAGKDLPPTYEQATLMDQAPRYSTLRLNALLETPPSTTSA